jgi:hypothetical protein
MAERSLGQKSRCSFKDSLVRFCEGYMNEKSGNWFFYVNANLVIVSGGVSYYLQVLDVLANKLFKDQLYRAWLQFGNWPLTPAGDIRPSETVNVKLVKTAWNDVSPESIVSTVEEVMCVKWCKWNRRWFPVGRRFWREVCH